MEGAREWWLRLSIDHKKKEKIFIHLSRLRVYTVFRLKPLKDRTTCKITLCKECAGKLASSEKPHTSEKTVNIWRTCDGCVSWKLKNPPGNCQRWESKNIWSAARKLRDWPEWYKVAKNSIAFLPASRTRTYNRSVIAMQLILYRNVNSSLPLCQSYREHRTSIS